MACPEYCHIVRPINIMQLQLRAELNCTVNLVAVARMCKLSALTTPGLAVTLGTALSQWQGVPSDCGCHVF